MTESGNSGSVLRLYLSALEITEQIRKARTVYSKFTRESATVTCVLTEIQREAEHEEL